MYNGIGLQTARGSGTNGYVTRNLAFVHQSKEKVKYKTEEEIKKWDQVSHKKPNQEILDHERKRKIELKCLELREELEEDGIDDDTIETKVAELRADLLKKAAEDKQVVNIYEIDEFGRPCVRETHQIAEAQQEKNRNLRAAFGISEHFVEGTSLDPNRRLREKAAKEAAVPKYSLVRTPSPEPEPAAEELVKVAEESKKSKRKHEKKSKKKSKSKDRDESDSSESSDEEEVKAKKSKKHSKRSRKSASPEPEKSKSGRDKSRGSRSPKRSPNRDANKSPLRESKLKSRPDAKDGENHSKSLDKQATIPASKDVPRKEKDSEPRRRDDSRDRDRSRSSNYRRHRDERESRDDRDRSSKKSSYSSHHESRGSERKSSPIDNRRKESLRDGNTASKSSDPKPVAPSKSEIAPQQTSRDARAEEESRNQVKEKMKADLARIGSIIDELGPRKSKKSRRSPSRSSSDSSSSSDSESSASSDSSSSSSGSESSQSSDSDSSSSDSSSSSSSSSGSSRKSSRRTKRKRSPSIPRRSGSPSFLDRRRITSARKRPVPYQRSVPSPSPSWSSSESCHSDYSSSSHSSSESERFSYSLSQYRLSARSALRKESRHTKCRSPYNGWSHKSSSNTPRSDTPSSMSSPYSSPVTRRRSPSILSCNSVDST